MSREQNILVKIHVKKAFWAFNKKKGHWFRSDCYAPIIKDRYGAWAKTPNGLVMVI